jgi:NhaP-type Na+/H+ or K+/H+ antiporter
LEALSTEAFAAVLALVGVVIVVAALLSGFIERNNFPQVAVFLGLGAVLGPSGLGLLNVTLDSPILRIVATLSLALVLFTDAVSLSIPEVKKHRNLALLVLGPGTLSSAALIALGAWWLLGLPPAAAIILAAALASTDPVLLRGLLRRPDMPRDARLALRLESGLNDVVLLPIVLVAMLFLPGGAASGSGGAESVNWAKLLLDLFLLGPAAGVLVGLLGVATLDLVRRRIGVRRDYESLYSLGIAFAAFAAAEAVHGSGFLAAFMAGLTISALDVELCDCFLEYGETTAEMALLFTFVLLGSSLIWSGFTLLSVAAVAFAVGTLLVRPATFLLSLVPAKLDRKSRFLISWFGPRGLSSLLLVLLPVFAGAAGSDRIFSYCCLVVVFSVALHGGSLMVLSSWKDRKNGTPPPEAPPLPPTEAEAAPPEIPVETAPARVAAPPVRLPMASGNGANTVVVDENGVDSEPAEGDEEQEEIGRERITIEQMQRLQESGAQVILLDARKTRSFNNSDETAAGAIRLDPDQAVRNARERNLPFDAWLIPFCT